MPHHFEVCGRTLASDQELPGLAAEKVAQLNRPDIQICVGFIPADIQRLIRRHTTTYYIEPGYEQGDPAHLVVNTPAGGRYYHFKYAEGVEFLLDLLSAEMRTQEFHFLSTLAATIEVRKLCPVDDMASIPQVRDMLLAGFKQVTGLAKPAQHAETTAP